MTAAKVGSRSGEKDGGENARVPGGVYTCAASFVDVQTSEEFVETQRSHRVRVGPVFAREFSVEHRLAQGMSSATILRPP